MDPQQAYIDWLEAIADNDADRAYDAAEALSGWLARGGFAPQWSDAEAARFHAWWDSAIG